MAALNLHREQPLSDLASNLRKAFSGIVAGNVKAEGVKQIRELGPFNLSGEADIMSRIDALLKQFVAQQRMKLPGTEYQPCYTINRET